MRGGRPLFDDEDEVDRFSGTPTPLNSHSRPKAVIGAVSPPQTMHAITSKGGGKGGSTASVGFGNEPKETKRQTGPKQSRAARAKERRAEKGGKAKKGGKR
jgi:hypothetical protein